MENTFNINAKIRVVLTKDGAKFINKVNHDDIYSLLNIFPNADVDYMKKYLKTDYVEGDVIEESLWYIFSILSGYFKGNTNAPFVNNEITFIE